MIRLRGVLLGAVIALLLGMALAQRQHDPLTDAEIDQLRDTAQEPDKRLKLYIDFARERLQTLDKARSDPKVKDRGQKTHDGLQTFLDVYDELDDNVDTFAERKEDLRKVLKTVIEADSEFQAKLRALKDAADVSGEELKQYGFVLTTAIEAVDTGVADHRQLQLDQEEAFKKKKKNKP